MSSALTGCAVDFRQMDKQRGLNVRLRRSAVAPKRICTATKGTFVVIMIWNNPVNVTAGPEVGA